MNTDPKPVLYRTDVIKALNVIAVLGCVWGFAIIYGFSHGASVANPNLYIVLVGWLALSANFLFGLYGTLDLNKGEFSRTNFFLDREKLSLNEIIEIKYQPVLTIGSFGKSIFIRGIHNGKKVNMYYFSNRNFSEKTLAKMARDLKVAASNIQLDDATDALVNKFYS